MHCIIAYAASVHLPANALDGLSLPRLTALLARLQCVGQDRDPPDDHPPAALPHERAHAQALGWDPTGPLPWAAWQSGVAAPQAQAWITPCHWQIGMDQVFMLDPQSLQLSDAHSRALLQAMQPYLAQDGLEVAWHNALHWRARGDLLAGWNAPSMDRVIGTHVRPWITQGVPTALARLHSEMQMLAYPHPVNDERAAQGLLPVNAFWVHGAGRWPPEHPTAPPVGEVRCLDGLRPAALRGDVPAWRAAWQALDAQLPDPDTPGLQLTLCSEHCAQHWQALASGWLARWRRAFSHPKAPSVLQALITP